MTRHCWMFVAWTACGSPPVVAVPPASPPGPCTTLPPVAPTTSPDGKTVVHIEVDPTRKDEGPVDDVPHMNLCVRRGAAPATLLVAGHRGGPSEMMVDFGNLVFDPSGTKLYFTTAGWVTSGAAHGVDLATGRTWFITDGAVLAQLTEGEHAGDLVMTHYRLDDEHTVDSPEYEGRREVFAIVGQDGTERKRLTAAQAQALTTR